MTKEQEFVLAVMLLWEWDMSIVTRDEPWRGFHKDERALVEQGYIRMTGRLKWKPLPKAIPLFVLWKLADKTALDLFADKERLRGKK